MDKPYHTTVIPKGTLLFRGVNSVVDLTVDFAGILSSHSNYCLYPNYNVFFYPYPFVSETVKKYPHICIFVLTRDIKLINLISPSPYVRSDRLEGKGGIISCDKIEPECVTKGRPYDPCINVEVVKDKSVVGMLGIAQTDAQSLRRLILKGGDTSIYYNKYFKLYKDSHHNIGIPEFVLYPKKTVEPQKTEQIEDFSEWIDKNKDELNYVHFHIMDYDRLDLEEVMENLMSSEGFKGMHAAINVETGFFQIIELSKEFKKTNDLSKESDDFIYTTAKKDDYNIVDRYKIERSIKKWVEKGDENEELVLNDLAITNIPELPNNVKRLHITEIDGLENLDNLPPNLIELVCTDSSIKSLGTLPKTLVRLSCSGSLIKSLDGLPEGLEYLSCSSCPELDEITKLPSSLIELVAENLYIRTLPTLPKSLMYLNIENCQNISKLPKLPSTLKYLNIMSTSIEDHEIPKKLPTGMKLIYDYPNSEDEYDPNNI